MNKLIIRKYFIKKAVVRFLLLLLIYALSLICCLWLAWQLRFDFEVPQALQSAVWLTVLWIVPVQLFLLALARQYSGLLSFFSIKDLVRLFIAMTSSVILVVTLW